MAAPLVLAVRTDLGDDLVHSILDTLFDNIHELLLVHTAAQEIRFQDAYSASLPADVAWHPGAQSFWEEEQQKLLITTGAITGLYYDLGKTIELLLQQSGIPARAIHTEGSVKNAFLLRDPRWKTLAFMQYDTALAAYLGSAGAVYGQGYARELQLADSRGNSLRVEGMRRIATFQEETVHFLIRTEKLAGEFTDRNPKLEALRGLRVSLGPRDSGTRLLARAILLHHGLSSDSIEEVHLSGPEMVAQLSEGDIDAAVMVESVPSQVLLTALEDDGVRLLSVDRGRLAKIISGAALTVTKIEPGTYGCQPPGAPAVDTVATRAVLVTTENIELDVSKITRVLFQGAAFMGAKDGGSSMAVELPSLPLHTQAVGYYQENGYLPEPPREIEEMRDWLEVVAAVLAILAITLGAYEGVLKLRRDRVGNEIGRRIFSISVSGNQTRSVVRLMAIRSEIDERVKKRWWSSAEMDKSRWRMLNDLIEDRVKEAKDTLTRSLLSEIRAAKADENVGEQEELRRLSALAEKAWNCLEQGELDESHHSLLLKVIQEHPSSYAAEADGGPPSDGKLKATPAKAG